MTIDGVCYCLEEVDEIVEKNVEAMEQSLRTTQKALFGDYAGDEELKVFEDTLSHIQKYGEFCKNYLARVRQGPSLNEYIAETVQELQQKFPDISINLHTNLPKK